jgi:hypothetical protein
MATRILLNVLVVVSLLTGSLPAPLYAAPGPTGGTISGLQAPAAQVAETPTAPPPTETASAQPPFGTETATLAPPDTETPAPTDTSQPTPSAQPPIGTDTATLAASAQPPVGTETPVPSETGTSTPLPPDTDTPTASAQPPTGTATPQTPELATATETASAQPPFGTLLPSETATSSAQPPTETATLAATPSPTLTATATLTPTASVQPPLGTPTLTATATLTPTATPASAILVSPLLECVADNGDGTYSAYFDYQNAGDAIVTIPVGPDNSFLPEPQDRGQPTAFEPGRRAQWPNSAFSVDFDGSSLAWTLNGGVAAASSASTACPQPPVAAFSAKPAAGPAPLRVRFFDESTGSVVTRTWEFGEGDRRRPPPRWRPTSTPRREPTPSP